MKCLFVKTSVLKYILGSEQELHANALSDTEEWRDFVIWAAAWVRNSKQCYTEWRATCWSTAVKYVVVFRCISFKAWTWMMLNIWTPTPNAGCFQDTHWQYQIWTSKRCMHSHLMLKIKKINRNNAHKTVQKSAARDAVYISMLLFTLGKIFPFLWYKCSRFQVLFLMPFLIRHFQKLLPQG